ncbi:MAG: hypothetical protein FWD39_02005 [Clostridiales bacterium]|nr:hypothetical protein [Clostridiales bacterium]
MAKKSTGGIKKAANGLFSVLVIGAAILGIVLLVRNRDKISSLLNRAESAGDLSSSGEDGVQAGGGGGSSSGNGDLPNPDIYDEPPARSRNAADLLRRSGWRGGSSNDGGGGENPFTRGGRGGDHRPRGAHRREREEFIDAENE